MIFESMFLVALVYVVFLILSYKMENDEELMSVYECGFDGVCSTRLVFSYRFFLISILFIIFDVEISLLLPVPFLMTSDWGLFVFFFFMIILIVGLFYEYIYGSLDWLSYRIE